MALFETIQPHFVPSGSTRGILHSNLFAPRLPVTLLVVALRLLGA